MVARNAHKWYGKEAKTASLLERIAFAIVKKTERGYGEVLRYYFLRGNSKYKPQSCLLSYRKIETCIVVFV